MTAQLATPSAKEGVVLMSEQEARSCVAEIKAGLEGVAERLTRLHEYRGWEALGYTTWQECIKHEFQMSRQRAHQLLTAHLAERMLASRNFDTGGMKTSHLAELAPLADDPDRMVDVASEVRETKGPKARAEHYRAVAGVKPPKARPSLSSRAGAGDFGDTYIEEYNQDPGDDIPVDADPDAAHLTDRGRSEARDGLLPPPATDADIGPIGGPEPAPTVTPDRPGTVAPPPDAGPKGASVATSPATPDEAVIFETTLTVDVDTLPDLEAQIRPAHFPPAETTNGYTSLSAGAGRRASVPSARVFADRQLDAGDLSRTLFDMAGWLEAITENATAGQKAALRQALGGTAQPAPSNAPAMVTVKDVKALIREHLTAADIRLLESELPMLRKEIGARERALAGATS